LVNTLEKEKKQLGEYFKKNGYITNSSIYDAFMKVPREEFVLEEDREHAYEDHPLPVLKNQTISAPHMCMLILSYGDFKPAQKVLEIGSGTGYQAALISELIGPKGLVYGIERHEILAEMGMKNLEKTGFSDRVLVIAGDGTLGWPDDEIPPFDRIVVTAAGPQIPQPLIDQLKVGGKLFMPLGDVFIFQNWIEVTKLSESEIKRKNLIEVRFVPLIGKYGLKEEFEF
jgi:protein-L-isoaspartate(D-aspartate) O-methyltransferase